MIKWFMVAAIVLALLALFAAFPPKVVMYALGVQVLGWTFAGVPFVILLTILLGVTDKLR